jgi:iron(III) transport system substrate-binding protein
VTRIEQEKSRPRCDVFWNNEILHTIRLQKQGLLQSRRWAIPDNWPANYRAKDGSWIGFAARARVLLINKEKLSDPSQWPSSVLELAHAKWHHRCGMAYPVYGTTATHMAVLASHANRIESDQEDSKVFIASEKGLRWEEWAKAVASNAVVLAGNKQVALAVSRGELDWGLTDTDDAAIEVESGHAVAICFPDQQATEFGTLFIPNSVAVLRGAPHPVAAASLADYLVSEKIESRLTMGNGAQFPIWPNAKEKPRLLQDRTVRWADANFEHASESWDATLEKLKTLFQR